MTLALLYAFVVPRARTAYDALAPRAHALYAFLAQRAWTLAADPAKNALASLIIFLFSMFCTLTSAYGPSPVTELAQVAPPQPLHPFLGYLGFNLCPEGSAKPPGSAGREAELAVLGISIGVAVVHLATILKGEERLLRPSAVVTGCMYAMSVITFAVNLSGGTVTACSHDLAGPPAFTIPGQAPLLARHVFQPLRYVYYGLTTPSLVVTLCSLAAMPESKRVAGAASMWASIVFGLISHLCCALSNKTLFWFFFVASCASFVGVCALLHEAQARARAVTSRDRWTQELVKYLTPCIAALWLAFPVVWTCAITGLVSPSVEAVAWPLLDMLSKVLVTQIWLLGDFSFLDAALRVRDTIPIPPALPLLNC